MYFLVGIISSFVVVIIAFLIQPKQLEMVKQAHMKFNIGKMKVDDLLKMTEEDLKKIQKMAYLLAVKTLSFSMILAFVFMTIFDRTLTYLFICLGLQLLFAFLFLYNFVTQAEKHYDQVLVRRL